MSEIEFTAYGHLSVLTVPFSTLIAFTPDWEAGGLDEVMSTSIIVTFLFANPYCRSDQEMKRIIEIHCDD